MRPLWVICDKATRDTRTRNDLVLSTVDFPLKNKGYWLLCTREGSFNGGQELPALTTRSKEGSKAPTVLGLRATTLSTYPVRQHTPTFYSKWLMPMGSDAPEYLALTALYKYQIRFVDICGHGLFKYKSGFH